MSRARKIIVYWSSKERDDWTDLEVEFSVGPPEISGPYQGEREVELVTVRDDKREREDIIESAEFQKALDVLGDRAIVAAWDSERDAKADALEREMDWRRDEAMLRGHE
jgi:hypothetical protein